MPRRALPGIEFWLSTATVMAVIGVWYAVTETKLVTAVLVPSPQKVVQALSTTLQEGYKGKSLLEHLAASLYRLLGSFALVLVTAIPLGLLSGLNSRVRAVLDPLVEFYRPLPPLAYYTLLVLWFGIDDTSKMALLYLGGFAPVFLACAGAVRKVKPDWVNAALTLGATKRQVFFRVIFPACLPDIFTGMRTAMGVAYGTLVAAEMVAAVSGIGWMVLDASKFLRSDIIFLGILLMGGTGILIDQGFRWWERRVLRWRATLPEAA